ncbi:hypothetical protein CI610_03213 [invertebrate metagenome]|uniref:Uncharacterized protein n=1 Tax=invertebrate metagenome TaxID=1711999 RepID=A0A2H9T3Q1_9ZZZZ
MWWFAVMGWYLMVRDGMVWDGMGWYVVVWDSME